MAGGIIYALSSAAAGLLATPWLLHWLGRERLGALKALTDWMGYLTFFELGMGGALMAALAIRIGRNDRMAVTGMLASGLRVYFNLMFVSLVCGIGLVLALPYVMPANDLSTGELRSAGVVVLLSLLLTPLLVFRALAEARQRSYLYWLLLSIQVLLMTGLSLIMARAGWGLVGQALAWSMAQVPTLLVLVWDGVRNYREVWRISPNEGDRKALLGLSWPTFVHQLADRIGLVSDNIMIAWILGPAALAPFYLTQQLGVLAQSQLRGLSSATWAGLVELYAHGEFAGFRLRLLQLTSLTSGLGLAILGPILTYNRSFIRFWVGQDVYAGELVTALTCLNIFLWSIFVLWGWMLLGTGHIRRWLPYSIASTIVNVSVSICGTFTLGVVGPLIGSAAGLLLITSWALPRVIRLVFGIPPWALWQSALIPLRSGLLYLLVMKIVSINYPPGGWLELIIWMSLWGAGGVVLWWKFGLRMEERAEWRERLRKAAPLP
jgi:O-antigen/teichoic acid export membrane protein